MLLLVRELAQPDAAALAVHAQRRAVVGDVRGANAGHDRDGDLVFVDLHPLALVLEHARADGPTLDRRRRRHILLVLHLLLLAHGHKAAREAVARLGEVVDGAERDEGVHVGREGDQTVDAVREVLVDDGEVLGEQHVHRLKRERHESAVAVARRDRVHGKERLPAGPDVAHAHTDHVGHHAQHELTDLDRRRLSHDGLKGREEHGLEMEAFQLGLLQELLRQLLERIDSEHRDALVVVAPDGREVI
mmetsp:Transcript_7247/g.25904  ORF Transcript_7247/g.25904 Transcript_7247/m.25904 type:complete len:247 (+) Transcript_7247:2165-2905(+)